MKFAKKYQPILGVCDPLYETNQFQMLTCIQAMSESNLSSNMS